MASKKGGRTRVAVACQGGGSHTAFTAGVLQGLLTSCPEEVDIVALSGTSGGAICATLAWEGLLRGNHDLAFAKLGRFWHKMAARGLVDKVANHALMGVMSLRDRMVLPEVSPYQLPTWSSDYFRDVLNEFFDFDDLRRLATGDGAPALKIGAVEVLSGHAELFTGPELRVECLLASAAIPEFFRAVHVPGRGVYWDGLFSQNPPIHDLMDHTVDEIWLVQINPSTSPRVPTETHEISDRRNALAGNLSMEQELRFIQSINRAIARGDLKNTRFRPIRVSRIALDRDLDFRTKLDRRPDLLEELREHGRTKWRWFVKERETAIESNP